MDRGFHFKPDEIEEELKKGGAKNIEDVWIFPPNAGKLCDPLDNNLWHSMKEKVRKINPVDERTTARAVKKAFIQPRTFTSIIATVDLPGLRILTKT